MLPVNRTSAAGGPGSALHSAVASGPPAHLGDANPDFFLEQRDRAAGIVQALNGVSAAAVERCQDVRDDSGR
jgi:hypothetical protein